jgi:hypothetical protein
MRTTVEIRDDQHAVLAALASRRGLRGFSLLVQEALDVYLNDLDGDRLAEVMGLRGTLSAEEAEELARRIDEAWSTWRTAS